MLYKRLYCSTSFPLLQGQPGASPFDFDESKIFHKFDLFTKRCKKLISMFDTIHQFSSLAQYTHLDGLDQMIKNFYNIVDDIKRKPYDLLDFYRTQFDRDFLEFNVNIHDLELSLQAFINVSFEQISSTEHALNLLRQFQAILHRDSLKVITQLFTHLCMRTHTQAFCVSEPVCSTCTVNIAFAAHSHHMLKHCTSRQHYAADATPLLQATATMPLLLQHIKLDLVLQADLAAKYVVIFQNYGLDLEAVQKLYEKHKHAPPVVRNAPPVAGNIMWARQLLRRIEMPMKR